MFYNYQGLSLNSNESSKDFNGVLNLTTASMGKIELISEENDRFPQLFKLMERITSGDTILVYSIAKFGVNRSDALNILCKLMDKNVGVISVVEGAINPRFVDFLLTGAVEVKNKRSTLSELLHEVS